MAADTNHALSEFFPTLDILNHENSKMCDDFFFLTRITVFILNNLL